MHARRARGRRRRSAGWSACSRGARRCSSAATPRRSETCARCRASIRSASLDCAYDRLGLYRRRVHCRSSNRIRPTFAMLLLIVVTRGAGAASRSGSRRLVSANGPRKLVPSCSSKPSSVSSRFGRRHHTGVVEQEVEVRQVARQPVGERRDGRRTTRGRASRTSTLRVGVGAPDLRERPLTLRRVADREDHVGAGGGQAFGGLAAGPAVGSGDDDGAAGLVGDGVHAGTVCPGDRSERHPTPVRRSDGSMTTVPHLTLNNGVEIPQLGFGVFQIPPEDDQGRGPPGVRRRLPPHRHGAELPQRAGRRRGPAGVRAGSRGRLRHDEAQQRRPRSRGGSRRRSTSRSNASAPTTWTCSSSTGRWPC